MGQLVAKHYRTALLLKAADHTYVECGTGGKGWSCWGGKTGGTVLTSGTGSTKRADAIAGTDERAFISCYLINGVCHQSANRILRPAGIIVSAARGYWLSSALFGTYGRPRGALGRCIAPFDQHTSVSGDLPKCVAATAGTMAHTMSRTLIVEMPSDPIPAAPNKREQAFLKKVDALYGQSGRGISILALDAVPAPELETFAVEHFELQVGYRLGTRVSRDLLSGLLSTRRSMERVRMHLETQLHHRELTTQAFASAFDDETINFQDSMANRMSEVAYQKLFGVNRDDRLVLTDPEAFAAAYRPL